MIHIPSPQSYTGETAQSASTPSSAAAPSDTAPDNAAPTYRIGEIISGYKLLRIEAVEDLDATLYELEHLTTHARHIHIANRDRENTFGVTFRTVPTDSTGVAHILEHTVLCGSEKYDVRDPFFSMLKRSLSTFMNALTASDWTMYPFSTQNEKDFYNLMDVYLDAAFFPKLERLSFKQEGHRLEIEPDENGEKRLIYKGVVYNEMKGAMSSPNQIMGRALMKALYPDTTYANNSGGEPSDIPTLTHEGLKAFHARYYHPSNAFFYTYGSFPLEKNLAFIEQKVLCRFTAIDPNSQVPSQPRWKAPKEVTVPYPLAKDEKPEKKYQACVAWLTADIRDSFEMLVLGVLEHILLGNAASPLRKRLIDSGLGSALSDGSGFDADMRDTMFACGLKEITKDDAGTVEKIIFDTLEELCTQGIDPKLLESAIHQIEFHKKEITNTPHPFGIKLLLSCAGTWIHEGDPVSCFKFDDDIDRLRKEEEKGGFLEKKIREYFIDNPHRVLFILAPDQTLEEKEAQRVEDELKGILAGLSDDAIAAIEKDARALETLQEADEDVSVLPTLSLFDVEPDIEIIHPDTVADIKRATCYDKATSGILYFTCPTCLATPSIPPAVKTRSDQGGSKTNDTTSEDSKSAASGNRDNTTTSDTSTVPGELIALIPFFCRAFTGAGTAVRDYAEMAELMDLYTGGVGISAYSGTGFNGNDSYVSFLSLQGKALERNIDPLFDIIGELITQYSFKDLTRLRNMLLQYRAGLESSIVANGHRYAISLASRNLTRTAGIAEMWHGISQFRFIRELTEKLGMPGSGDSEATAGKARPDEALEILSEQLATIAGRLFKTGNMKPALAGQKTALIQADKNIDTLFDALTQSREKDFKQTDRFSPGDFPFEGWSTSTSVSFVAQSFKTVRMGHDDAPALAAISKILRSLYLHREIREKGGAYGGFALYNAEEGIFSFASYRDPNIRRTLEVYQNACDYIKGGSYTDEDIKEAVLQVCSEIDKPDTPGPASIKAFYRELLGLTDEKRRQFKASLLGLDKKRIIAAAERYFITDGPDKGTAVISSKEALEGANQNLKMAQEPLRLFKI